jgi:hypothetical protein
MNTRFKSIPKFRNETEERRFWETHDSSNYVDWSKASGCACQTSSRRRLRFPCVCR